VCKILSSPKHQWLTPVILTTQEVEIRDSQFKASPGRGSQDSIWKNPSQKRADGVAQGVVSEFKPQYWGEKRKKMNWKGARIYLRT
jgi:hypothetical protein